MLSVNFRNRFYFDKEIAKAPFTFEDGTDSTLQIWWKWIELNVSSLIVNVFEPIYINRSYVL